MTDMSSWYDLHKPVEELPDGWEIGSEVEARVLEEMRAKKYKERLDPKDFLLSLPNPF